MSEYRGMIYAGIMTLSQRNIYFRTGIITCGLSLLLIIAAAYIVSPAYPQVLAQSAIRSSGIFPSIIKNILTPSPNVPFAAILAAAVYALAGIILIYFYFEKTHSPEILFISLFIVSMALESARITLPLRKILDISNSYVIYSYRILIFGRFFGLFSLFVASICTAGLKIQKEHNIVIVTAMAALIIAMGIPVDGLAWDSTMSMLSGYSSTLVMIELSILGITIASFLISAYTRGSKNYLYIGLGALLTYLGRGILLNSDTWITPAPGLIILTWGTWIICTKFHSIYLWL